MDSYQAIADRMSLNPDTTDMVVDLVASYLDVQPIAKTFLRLDDEQLMNEQSHNQDVHQSPVNSQLHHFRGRNSSFVAVETADTVSMDPLVVQMNLAFAHLQHMTLVVQPTVNENVFMIYFEILIDFIEMVS